ncbi:hypothetical protein LOTGIDRAFT_174890 [Lottia gigantea]|uniref:Alpha-type protein kinase domain-containing protein n=1 Tax=Lottia gigantea TaxID=225164 RepID=V4ARH8_LOTGI|nr:hypothetical protein LOTGIDRAFT_174890 [Lottia gigantea]ESO96321.1 hypothetical protein LOTGIDRAFT_174890 [Lottia gigantea]
MGLVYVSTLNSSPDDHGCIWTASFEKKGCKGTTCKGHKARKFSRNVFERQCAIVRTFLRSEVSSKQCDMELMKVAVAKEIIQAFNERCSNIYGVRIRINSVVKALIDSKHDEWCLIEDRCKEPFICFVDRYGKPKAAKFQILQTLVHFSYHYTSGNLIITSLKGCRDSKSFTLSIPTIHSVYGCFGEKDESLQGIKKCLDLHTCNHDCSAFIKHSEMRPRAPSAPYDPEVIGPNINLTKKRSEKGTCNDNLVIIQSESEKETGQRLRATSSPVDIKLYLKDDEAFTPPPYSPVDPYPLCGEFLNHSLVHGPFSVFPFEDALPLRNTNVSPFSDDVFR